MMKLGRSIAAHSILAVGGLLLAYLVWTDDSPERSPDEVTITSCDAAAIQRVELEMKDKDVRLEMRGEQGGDRYAWLTVERRPESGQPSTDGFVGSEAVREWLSQIAPLRARRSLGELSAEQLADVGLAEPEGKLRLHCGDQTATFSLGSRAYGTGDRYVRAEAGGPVYLLASDRLSPLESAEFRLMERQLHTFEWRDVVSLRLRAFGQEREYLQHNRLDQLRAEWVDARTPDRRDETFGNWLSRFPRLRVQRYLEPDARPGAELDGVSAASERVVRLDYRGPRRQLGFLEIERVMGAAEPTYYARTETTRGWVTVPTSIATQIEDDLRAMLDLPPLERPSTAPASGADAASSSDSTSADESEGERASSP